MVGPDCGREALAAGPLSAMLTFRGMPGLPALGEHRVEATKICSRVERAQLAEEGRQHRWSKDAGLLWKMEAVCR